MADILIDSSVDAFMNDPLEGVRSRLLVDKDSSTLYLFYPDSDRSLNYKKSTDGGQTWGTNVEISAAANSGQCICVWYDKWTSGDTGTKIHIAYENNTDDDVWYRSLDVSSDTLSSAVAVALGTNIGNDGSNFVQITKARGGNLYVYYSGFNGGNYNALYRSVDAGANWTSRTTFGEGDDNDHAIIVPGNEADNQDIWCVFGDNDANEWSLKVYDDSANTVGETAIVSTPVGNDTSQISASIRHSDGHMILAINSDVDTATADMLIYDINGSGSITAKTNIITDKDDWANSAVYIDQNTDYIYVAWIGNPDGSETFGTSSTIWRSRSTDGGTTWDTPVQVSESAGSNLRGVWTSHSTPGDANGRFLVMWYDEADDLFNSYVNSVAITAGGATSGNDWPVFMSRGFGNWKFSG